MCVLYGDFETCTDENNKHVAYMLWVYSPELKKMFIFDGLDCANQFKNFIQKAYKGKWLNIYFHNLGFDFSYLINDFYIIRDPVIKDNQLFEVTCKVGDIDVSFRDSYKLLPMKLMDIPAFCGSWEFEKEVYPYELNTLVNLIDNMGECNYSDIADEKKWIIIKENCKWLNFEIDEDTFDLWQYSGYYCERDVMVLFNGMGTLAKVCRETINLDVFEFLSLSSLADWYLYNENVYDDIYQIGGVCRDFIQNCVVGGWVMCNNNEKQVFDKDIDGDVMQDFDAVSLYPSAMIWLIGDYGLPCGIPKMLNAD